MALPHRPHSQPPATQLPSDVPPDGIWKILVPGEVAALPRTQWKGTSMDQADGFLHLSSTPQVLGTLNRFYGAPATTVVLCLLSLLTLREEQSTHLKWEVAPDGAGSFPHLYSVRLYVFGLGKEDQEKEKQEGEEGGGG